MSETNRPQGQAPLNNLAAPRRLYGLIPAAGVGTRMGSAVPKQFLTLGRASILEHAVRALLADNRVQSVLIVIAPDDQQTLSVLAPLLKRMGGRIQIARCGGATRAASVLNGLQHLQTQGVVQTHDWVLVHDAARPGLSPLALARLIDAVQGAQLGAILAMPVADTVKHQVAQQVAPSTVNRDDLWLAQTPQMFEFGLLLDALTRYKEVTDEAQAIALAGHAVQLVVGERRNLKVTHADDLTWLSPFFQ
jgi:2-C-methyl-D-erythritol 4-phosphate cytidylyltransferase